MSSVRPPPSSRLTTSSTGIGCLLDGERLAPQEAHRLVRPDDRVEDAVLLRLDAERDATFLVGPADQAHRLCSGPGPAQ